MQKLKLGNQVRAIIEANHEHKESQYSSHGKQRIKAANIISLVHCHVGRYKICLISSPPKQKKCTSVPFQDESFRGKICQGATMSNITKNGLHIYIYTLDVRRPSIQWWLFQKDDDFRIYNQQFHGTMILIYSNGL